MHFSASIPSALQKLADGMRDKGWAHITTEREHCADLSTGVLKDDDHP
jgi:hypothetical protein